MGEASWGRQEKRDEGEMCAFLFGNPEGKRLHVNPRRRWEDNIRIYLKLVDVTVTLIK